MAYGSYGISLDLSFNVKYIPLLRRGFNLAFAHIRGGGERGKHWYESGRCLNKKNGIQDLRDVAMHLKSNSQSHQIFGLGVSAGAVPFGKLYHVTT